MEDNKKLIQNAINLGTDKPLVGEDEYNESVEKLDELKTKRDTLVSQMGCEKNGSIDMTCVYAKPLNEEFMGLVEEIDTIENEIRLTKSSIVNLLLHQSWSLERMVVNDEEE